MTEYEYIADDSKVCDSLDKLFRDKGYKAIRLLDEEGKDIEQYKGGTSLFGVIQLKSRERYFGTSASPKTEIKIRFLDVDVRIESRLEEAVRKTIENFSSEKILNL